MTDTTPERDLAEYGASVRDARERAGKRQMQFAAEVGISPSHLSNLEAGRKRPSRAVYWRIATALNLSNAEAFERVAS